MFDLQAALTPPRVTEALSGTGGRIKSQPDHFCVTEIPLYEPSGSGDHIYLTFCREGATTEWLMRQTAQTLDLKEVDVGAAGLKDKHARAVQTFSLHMPRGDAQQVAQTLEEALPITVLSVSRHGNKLRRGHLVGNRFRIVVDGPAPDALARCQAVLALLYEHGLPNFYGPQRFGNSGDNAERARAALIAGKRLRHRDRFLLSSYQSALFNIWLSQRIARGDFARLILGDVAKKVSSGGLFVVEDLAVDNQRLAQRELTYTGPIIGHDLKHAEGDAAIHEQILFSEDGIPPQRLKQARLAGSRRSARLYLDQVTAQTADDGALILEFELPKGAYATTVLREIMGCDPT